MAEREGFEQLRHFTAREEFTQQSFDLSIASPEILAFPGIAETEPSNYSMTISISPIAV